jgi:hypothetical protein
MLVIIIVIKLMVAFHVIIITLETLRKQLLSTFIVFLLILDYRLSEVSMDLHTITLIARCIRKRIGNLGLQHIHHLSHWTNQTIETISFRYSDLSFKHFNHFFNGKLNRSSRVPHIVNDHIEEYLRILKFYFKLLNFLPMIFLQLSNFILENLILLLTYNCHFQIVELLKLKQFLTRNSVRISLPIIFDDSIIYSLQFSKTVEIFGLAGCHVFGNLLVEYGSNFLRYTVFRSPKVTQVSL